MCKQPATEENGPIESILQNELIGKLPGKELQDRLESFLEPVLAQPPEKRLRDVAKMAVQVIVAAQSPVLAEAARQVSRTEETVWPTAERLTALPGVSDSAVASC